MELRSNKAKPVLKPTQLQQRLGLNTKINSDPSLKQKKSTANKNSMLDKTPRPMTASGQLKQPAICDQNIIDIGKMVDDERNFELKRNIFWFSKIRGTINQFNAGHY